MSGFDLYDDIDEDIGGPVNIPEAEPEPELEPSSVEGKKDESAPDSASGKAPATSDDKTINDNKEVEKARIAREQMLPGLFVSKLGWWITDADLESLFGPYGELKTVKIYFESNNGKSKGYAYVDFKDPRNVTPARNELHGKQFNECQLSIEFATENKMKQIDRSNVMVGRNKMNGAGDRGGPRGRRWRDGPPRQRWGPGGPGPGGPGPGPGPGPHGFGPRDRRPWQGGWGRDAHGPWGRDDPYRFRDPYFDGPPPRGPPGFDPYMDGPPGYYDDRDRPYPPRDRDDRGPPRNRDDRGPPRNMNDRGPQINWDDRGPPRNMNDRGPQINWDDRGPPRNMNDRGPQINWDDRGPPRNRDNRGPFRDRDDRGPPRDRNERGRRYDEPPNDDRPENSGRRGDDFSGRRNGEESKENDGRGRDSSQGPGFRNQDRGPDREWDRDRGNRERSDGRRPRMIVQKRSRRDAGADRGGRGRDSTKRRRDRD